MTKHTPGPWVKDMNEVYGPENLPVADCNGRTVQECNANARLIAASPDLLEALEGLVLEKDYPGMSEPERQLHQAARAAIAKATGTEILSINNGETP